MGYATSILFCRVKTGPVPGPREATKHAVLAVNLMILLTLKSHSCRFAVLASVHAVSSPSHVFCCAPYTVLPYQCTSSSQLLNSENMA